MLMCVHVCVHVYMHMCAVHSPVPGTQEHSLHEHSHCKVLPPLEETQTVWLNNTELVTGVINRSPSANDASL